MIKKTALHYATEGNNLELMQYLVAQGADIHFIDYSRENIFYYATESFSQQHKELVEIAIILLYL
ncbi:MAG: ankyrin repeat domain-containing protein [Rickettsiales endosymbiont of Dermacentor nuttalli]